MFEGSERLGTVGYVGSPAVAADWKVRAPFRHDYATSFWSDAGPIALTWILPALLCEKLGELPFPHALRPSPDEKNRPIVSPFLRIAHRRLARPARIRPTRLRPCPLESRVSGALVYHRQRPRLLRHPRHGRLLPVHDFLFPTVRHP